MENNHYRNHRDQYCSSWSLHIPKVSFNNSRNTFKINVILRKKNEKKNPLEKAGNHKANNVNNVSSKESKDKEDDINFVNEYS